MATLWTLGHSNHSLADFLGLLHAHGIEAVADVRRFPGSRKYPHFRAEALAESLPADGIEYHAFRELGGRRTPRPDSKNTAWRVAGFRAYADFMETPEFEQALGRLLTLAERRRTAILCAEAVWWRCHRGLISDALKVRGHTVLHILGPQPPEEHPYTSAARIIDGRLSYTAPEDPTLFT